MKNCNNKECTKDNPQPLDAFALQKRHTDGRSNRCKTCINEYGKANYVKHYERKKKYFLENSEKIKEQNKRKWINNREKLVDSSLKSIYGITLEQYNKMLVQQNNACAICHKPSQNQKRRLHVDHDHITGKVRGLLCVSCNQGLGMFKDDPDRIRKAIQYLKDYE